MSTTERPVDRFARLVADIRRTHPMTASVIALAHAHGVVQQREGWLVHYLPQLEREWAAGDGRAATTEGEGE